MRQLNPSSNRGEPLIYPLFWYQISIVGYLTKRYLSDKFQSVLRKPNAKCSLERKNNKKRKSN